MTFVLVTFELMVFVLNCNVVFSTDICLWWHFFYSKWNFNPSGLMIIFEWWFLAFGANVIWANVSLPKTSLTWKSEPRGSCQWEWQNPKKYLSLKNRFKYAFGSATVVVNTLSDIQFYHFLLLCIHNVI
jgi:hypothetical protein